MRSAVEFPSLFLLLVAAAAALFFSNFERNVTITVAMGNCNRRCGGGLHYCSRDVPSGHRPHEISSYGRAKERYSRNREEKLSPGLHLASAAEAGALVSLCTNPIWLIKTRLQLQNTLNQNRPYAGIYGKFFILVMCSESEITISLYSYGNSDSMYALRTILREEGWTALYKGLGPGLLMVSHGAIQFTAYEELRRRMVDYKARKQKSESASNLLNSFDYAVLGGSSKIAAILITYPFQQRPSDEGIPRYMNSWHVVKETTRFEGVRGFYRGITANLLKNVPASSITFIVYENVLKLLRPTRKTD
ncbi:hypothetical protein V6N13_024148 [Hibiscus sabdariffa]|uniref:Uncharacterized protein n=1 Tax=Hibiscus sabdariffa TaxID=183260 RepID=A0ABR1ZJ82_9ROSI